MTRPPDPAPNRVLRAWREGAGLTRVAVVDALNKTPSALQKHLICDAKRIEQWESGQERWPSLKYRQLLCELTSRDLQALGFIPPPSTSKTRPAPQPIPAQVTARAGTTRFLHRTTRSGRDDLQTAARPALVPRLWHGRPCGPGDPSAIAGYRAGGQSLPRFFCPPAPYDCSPQQPRSAPASAWQQSLPTRHPTPGGAPMRSGGRERGRVGSPPPREREKTFRDRPA